MRKSAEHSALLKIKQLHSIFPHEKSAAKVRKSIKLVKRMAIEWQIFILLCCIAATAYTVHYLHRKDAETSEHVFWANVRQPQIVEQRFATTESQLIAVQEYETALKKIVEHGNKWITAADIHPWFWGNDAENTQVDFYRWQFLNIERRARLMEAFFAQKAKQAEAAKNEAAAAKMWASNDEPENLN